MNDITALLSKIANGCSLCHKVDVYNVLLLLKCVSQCQGALRMAKDGFGAQLQLLAGAA